MMKYNCSLKLTQKTTSTLKIDKTYLADRPTLDRGTLKFEEEA